MNMKERYEITTMLESLTIEQKKEFLLFLRTLQQQEQQSSASATTAHNPDRTEQSKAQHDTATTQASHSTTADPAPSTDHQRTSTQAHTPTTATDEAPDSLNREPQSTAEARQRIRYMYLPDVTDEPGYYYFQAITEFLDDAPFTYRNLQMAIIMGYAAGVQHGKHLARAKRQKRAKTPITTQHDNTI